MVIGVFQLIEWYPLCHDMLYSVYRMSINDGFIYFIIVLLILSGPLAFFVFSLFIVDSMSCLVIACSVSLYLDGIVFCGAS